MSNSGGPLVSVIIASYNKAGLITQTLESVINQTYVNWELIIVDDSSTDDTLSILSKFEKDSRIKLYKNETNLGANFCRNYGVKLSNGQYIVFLDADDLLTKNCLKTRVEKSFVNPEANLLVFSMGVFYKEIGDSKHVWQPISKKPLNDFLQHKLPWSILQPFWKREFLLELKGFDETFLRLQDVELNTRALLSSNISYKLYIGEPDCFYRIDESRKNYNAVVFLERWVDSAVKYYLKFYPLIKQISKQNYLLGTIYETLLQLTYHYRIKKINKPDFKFLKSKLLEGNPELKIKFFKKVIFGIAQVYNIYCFRIPGVNKVFKFALTH